MPGWLAAVLIVYFWIVFVIASYVMSPKLDDRLELYFAKYGRVQVQIMRALAAIFWPITVVIWFIPGPEDSR